MTRSQLELDFVVPPRRPVWLGLLLLVVALGVATDLALRLRDARDELSHMEATRSLLNAVRPPARRMPVGQLDEEAKAAAAIVRQLTLPWATLIEVLENATVKDVAVLQVQPEAQQRLLRITAEARNHGAMLQFLRNLAATSALNNVHLLNHQVQFDDPEKPLQFSLQATIAAAL
jgi:hypothetical protein